MKEKKLEKAEMKESILTGEALALNDAELEGATGGVSNSERGDGYAYVLEVLEQVHEASKGGGNSPVKEADREMIKQEMMEHSSEIKQEMMEHRSEMFEAWQQKMSGAGIPGLG